MNKKKIFFPNLDGLRFFCFLSVFLYHSFGTNYAEVRNNELYWTVKHFFSANGNLGVNFFFVLSGFLITYLLLEEKIKMGGIGIKSFYIRRVLRIWPLFYFCVIFGFFIFPVLKQLTGEVPAETANIAYYLTFLNNFDLVKHGLPDSSTLTILWSVAIEEQFYLVWPILLTIIPVRYYRALFAIIIGVSFVFRYLNADNALILENHTLSCISDMTIGGLFASLASTNRKFETSIVETRKNKWVFLYLITLIIFLFRKEIFNHGSFLIAADRLVIAIVFAFIILEQNFAKHSLFKMSKYKLISKLGTYTYGLYCLHMIGILIVAVFLRITGLNTNVYEVIFLEGGLSLFITIVLAWFSYTYFESWFLKIKTRYARITK